jgi:hypothetical protein
MTASQNVTVKIIAPNTHQLLRSLRAIESLNPNYIEGPVKQNDLKITKQEGVFCFITFPLNWFLVVEKALVEKDNSRYAEQPSQEPLCIATANPENLGAVY